MIKYLKMLYNAICHTIYKDLAIKKIKKLCIKKILLAYVLYQQG